MACSKPPAPPAKAPEAPPPPKVAALQAVRERIAPRTCAARSKLAALLGHQATTQAPVAVEAADSAAPPTSMLGEQRIPANQTYRVVAPETVLLRTDDGMGTGVVIDPKGYVLTNYHVVADGRKQDFVVSVNVTLGDLSPTGRMVKQEKTYEGVVVKADLVRDMAIVKIKDPPPNLKAVKLAKSAPQIAEKVISVGHAGIGFLWAAKTCSIASVGERQQDASRLAMLDCASADPALTPDEAQRFKSKCSDTKKQMADALMASTQGLAIQTDCAITHGDSGGPLVNVAGELVGLNQSISADLATAAFHVHLDEIRDFAAAYPEQGVALLPDPFCDGGNDPSLEDVDLDGVPDTLVSKGGTMFGIDRMAVLIDLDQDNAKHAAKRDPNNSGDPFDAELALFREKDTTYVWWDTDDDNRFDLLLVDKDNDGVPEKAYRLDANGQAKEDPSAVPKHDFSAKYLKDRSLEARLGTIAQAIGGAKYTSARVLAAAARTNAIPDPILGGGTSGRVADTDDNRHADLAAIKSVFSRALLIDADEDSLGALKSGDAVDELLKARKVDAEVSVVIQGNSVWASYDTDNDGKFDLALVSANGSDPSALVATNAWRIDGTETTPAPEHLGRKILRPGLMPAFPRVATGLKLVTDEVASNEGLGSLPDPLAGPKARFAVHPLKGIPDGSVIETTTSSWTALLVDVDRDTKLPKLEKGAKIPEVQALVRDGKFDAEVAYLHHFGPGGGADYVFYDTDNDGKFDLVLYARESGNEPTQAYRVVDGKLVADAAAVKGRLMRTKSVFKNKALATKWKTIATKAFKPGTVEE